MITYEEEQKLIAKIQKLEADLAAEKEAGKTK